METDRERLEHLIRTLADVDLEYDFTPERIKSMRREQAELEAKIKRECSQDMT